MTEREGLSRVRIHRLFIVLLFATLVGGCITVQCPNCQAPCPPSQNGGPPGSCNGISITQRTVPGCTNPAGSVCPKEGLGCSATGHCTTVHDQNDPTLCLCRCL